MRHFRRHADALTQRRMRVNRLADVHCVGVHPDSQRDLTGHVTGVRANHAAAQNAALAMRPHLLARPIYGSGLNPSSFKKLLCFCFAAAMAFSISTNSPCVASRLISASPTAVLM